MTFLAIPPPVEIPKKLKKKYVWWALIACILVLFAVGINQSQVQAENNKNFNLNVTEADKSFKLEKYDEAKQYYQTALTYKVDNNVQPKITLCDNLNGSLNNYNFGITSMVNKDYLKAINMFKGVVAQDEKRFGLAKDKITESIKLYSDDAFAKAKDYSNQNLPKNSISEINTILVIDQNNETAKTLNIQYQAESDAKDIADIVKAEAKAVADRVKKEAEDKALALANAQDKANAEAKSKADAKSKGVIIGMTTQEVLDSSWGKPEDINRTIGSWGTHEQWVYAGFSFLYFEDRILTSIQN